MHQSSHNYCLHDGNHSGSANEETCKEDKIIVVNGAITVLLLQGKQSAKYENKSRNN